MCQQVNHQAREMYHCYSLKYNLECDRIKLRHQAKENIPMYYCYILLCEPSHTIKPKKYHSIPLLHSTVTFHCYSLKYNLEYNYRDRIKLSHQAKENVPMYYCYILLCEPSQTVKPKKYHSIPLLHSTVNSKM